MSAAAAPAVPLLAEGVTVRYGERVALHELDLTVQAGELVAIAGPNGSGKTTLLSAALGFVPLAAGELRLFGRTVASLSFRERARAVAWVPQIEAVRENVRLVDYVLHGRYPYLRFLEREGPDDLAVADEVLAGVGLADRAADGLLSLSGGERQRAVLARAFAQTTPLLLLDEPTAHLDIGHQLDVLARVRQLSRQRGVAVVAALHDLNLAARFADRIVVLSRGRKAADGPPREVLSPELLERVWGITAELHPDPRSGTPYLVPHRLSRTTTAGPATEFGPVHVVGGGGAAAPVLRALVDDGYRVTAGTLHMLDSDTEAAEALGVPAAVEAPFAPIGAEARGRHRELLAAARAIVVAPFPVGPANLANLEDVGPFAATTPCYCLAGAADRRARDFTGGRATALLDALLRSGAREVGDIPQLLRELSRLATEARRDGAALRADRPAAPERADA